MGFGLFQLGTFNTSGPARQLLGVLGSGEVMGGFELYFSNTCN